MSHFHINNEASINGSGIVQATKGTKTKKHKIALENHIDATIRPEIRE